VLRLAGVEHGVDRVEREQGRHQRLALLDEVARVHAAVADAARARGADLGELQVELRLAQRGAGGGEAGLRLAQGAPAGVHLGLRREALLHQRRGALQLLLGEEQPRLRAPDFGPGALHGDLERALV
jgi:hypothetical protein